MSNEVLDRTLRMSFKICTEQKMQFTGAYVIFHVNDKKYKVYVYLIMKKSFLFNKVNMFILKFSRMPLEGMKEQLCREGNSLKQINSKENNWNQTKVRKTFLVNHLC